MKRGLELFVEALGKCALHTFTSIVTIIPMSKPAYKEVTIQVYKLTGSNKELFATQTSTYKITTEQEKESAIDDLTEDIISIVLKKKVL